jgi:triacylglycerol lipase
MSMRWRVWASMVLMAVMQTVAASSVERDTDTAMPLSSTTPLVDQAVATTSAAVKAATAADNSPSCVVMLHGLAGRPWNFNALARTLTRYDHPVEIPAYSSRHLTIEQAANVVAQSVNRCHARGATTVDLVGHSLGGLLIRQYLSTQSLAEQQRLGIGRVVMLGTPNQGSVLSDDGGLRFGYEREIAKWMGPVVAELGTGNAGPVKRFGPMTVPTGVVAGYYSLIPWFNRRFAEPNDGLVSVRSTRVAGMKDFIEVPENHLKLAEDPDVQRQVLWFLHTGHFYHPVNN